MLGTPSPTPTEQVALGLSEPDVGGAHPIIAVVLAIVVGLAVFALLWRMRRTFGLKE